MSRQSTFDDLPEFLAIARHQSIRKAALELCVTPGAVSQSLKRLESRLGSSLFHRTTRSIALTEAGDALLAKVGPALQVIEEGIEEALQSAAEPAGTLRLLVERLAVPHVIAKVLPAFRETWPRVRVDITVSNRHDDFIAGAYDAGIMIGSYIPEEMIAIRLSPTFHWAVFGAPDYLRRHGRPQRPSDLLRHQCIRFRRPEKGDIYRWEFIEDGRPVCIEPDGAITVNDAALMGQLATQGLGLIYSSTFHSSQAITQGLLEPVLMDYSPGTDCLYLYFTRAAQGQPKLRAFVEACVALRKSVDAVPKAGDS